MLAQERVKELFDYDPEFGLLTYKIKVNTKRDIGDQVGWLDDGYRKMLIDYKQYKVHRIIYLWMTGEFPKNDTDHINGNKSDNRWLNLRDATRSENSRNRRLNKNNSSGFCGVSIKENGSWQSSIRVKGKNKILGTFEDIADAINARKQANIKYNFHPNHGRR